MEFAGFNHEKIEGRQEWLTPPYIIKALGDFDLDPCSPIIRPWDTAKHHYCLPTEIFGQDGLEKIWWGRVWLNPPYGSQTGRWLKRLSLHGNGIALIFARTETKNFFNYIWPVAKGILFLKGRLIFYNIDGTKPKNSAGAPSCLIAYGENNAEILKNCSLIGKYLEIK